MNILYDTVVVKIKFCFAECCSIHLHIQHHSHSIKLHFYYFNNNSDSREFQACIGIMCKVPYVLTKLKQEYRSPIVEHISLEHL
jgi:hypothetical protein